MSTCFECGSVASHRHHVVPKSKGGTKTVPLCECCHGKVHGRNFLDHRLLTIEGLRRAKARGVQLGARPCIPPNVEHKIKELRESGLTLRAIADSLNAQKVDTGQGEKRWYASTVKSVLDRVA